MEKEKKEQKQEGKGFIAAVRVRGSTDLSHDVIRTLELLNLNNKNWCVLLKESPSIKGMLHRVKDFVTWGEISNEEFEELVKKRGELYNARLEDTRSEIKYNKFIELSGKKYKRMFRLSPPKKGYGRKGIKIAFTQGGALGNRGERINDLLKRMI